MKFSRLVSLPEFSENEVAAFPVGVAVSTGSWPLGRQFPVSRAATWETHKAPAAGCAMGLALLHHDINPARWPLYGVTRNHPGFKQVINNHGAVRKLATRMALKGLFVYANMADSPFGSKGGALGPDW